VGHICPASHERVNQSGISETFHQNQTSMKFNEQPFIEFGVVTCRQTDGGILIGPVHRWEIA